MPKRSRKSTKIGWWLVAIVWLSILLITYQVKTGRRIETINRPVISFFSFFHKAIVGMNFRAASLWESYIWLVNTEQENIRLRQESNQLKEIINNCQEYRLENERLRALLKFKKKAAISAIPAQVISRDPSSLFRTIVIDKGSQDKVDKNQAVVTHQGVVGRTIEVYPSTSKVLLVCDPNSSLAVLVQRTRDEAIVAGWREDTFKLNYLPRSAQATPGDIVVTSGLGGIFPKGLMVGTLTSLKKSKYGLFQSAEVVPSVDFSKLEEVLVIN